METKFEDDKDGDMEYAFALLHKEKEDFNIMKLKKTYHVILIIILKYYRVHGIIINIYFPHLCMDIFCNINLQAITNYKNIG